ncbi:MAG: hypothetical protein ACLR8Y_18035 [Alistipes indistinctus]
MSGADTVTTAASASVAYFNIDSLIQQIRYVHRPAFGLRREGQESRCRN